MNAEEVLPVIKKAEGYPTSNTISKADPRGGRGGAVGVNQVMPDTAKAYGFDPARLHDDDYNDTVAKFVVSDLHSKFGADDLKSTLIGYNAGPGAVERWQAGGRDDGSLPAQTQEYIRRAGLDVRTAQANPVPDGKPQADFASAQSRSRDQSIDAEWNALLAHEKPPTGQAPQPTQTASTGYINPNTPFGVQAENYASNFMRSAKAAATDGTVQAATSLAGAAGARYAGGISGAWNKLKGDFTDYLSTIGAGSEVAKLPVWDRLKKEFEQTVQAGKLPVDAFKLAVSPILSAIDTAQHGVAEGGQALTGIPAEKIDSLINTAMLGLGPAKGLGGALAEGAGATEAVGATTKAAETAAPEAAAAEAPRSATVAAQPRPIAAEAAKAETVETHPFTFGEDARIEPTEADKANTVKFLNGDIPDNPIHASLEKLSDSEEMSKAVADVARFIPPHEVKPDDILRMGAYSFQMDPEQILAGFKTTVPSDEQMGAAAMLVNSTAKELKAAADAFAASGTPEDFQKAVKAFALQNKIIGDWNAMGTETGRALRARGLVWDTRADFTRMVQGIISDVGSDNAEEAIRRISSMDSPEKVNAYLGSMRRFTGRDGILYGWYNILLSNPKTVIKKLTSDALMATWNVGARYAAEKFGNGGVAAGETSQLIYGYTSGMGDNIRAAGKALKAGSSQFDSEYQTVEGINRNRISQLANGIQPGQQSVSSATTNFLRSALPTSWIGAADDFAKTANYRAELRSLAFRRATDDATKDASINPASRMQDLLNNVPGDLHERAIDAARSNTFQDPLTGMSSSLQDTMDKINLPLGKTGFELPLGRIIMPFIRIPANIAKYAYRNSPLPLAFPTQGYLEELRTGGARGAIARARVGIGSAVSMIGAGLAYNGTITGNGPTDRQLRQAWLDAGNQPYSIKVGSTWYGYRYVEPIGMILGTIADTADLMRFAKERDSEQAATSLMFGAGNAMLNASYLSGMSDFLEALQQPDQEGQFYATNLISSLATPPGVAGMAQAIDPWRRAHQGLLQSIEARTPFLSEGLPPQRTMWGDAIPWRDGFLPPISSVAEVAPLGVSDIAAGASRMLSPISQASASAEPIDKWIYDHRMDFADADRNQTGITKVSRIVTQNSGPATARAELTDAQFDRYQVLAGNGLKDTKTGLGAKDYLNALVRGDNPDRSVQDQWDGASDGAKAFIVQRVWGNFKQAARGQIIKDNQDVQDALTAGLQSRAAQMQVAR